MKKLFSYRNNVISVVLILSLVLNFIPEYILPVIAGETTTQSEAEAQSDEFSVSRVSTSNNVSTYEIKRTSNSGIEKNTKVYYRTINGSAVGGTHFTHTDGFVTFSKDDTVKTFTVRETAFPGGITNISSRYQNVDRTYEVEVYSAATPPTRIKRTLSYGSSYNISQTMFLGEVSLGGRSGSITHGDYDDDKLGWNNDYYLGHTDSFKIDESRQDYLKAAGFSAADQWVRMSFSAKEIDDGYPSLQLYFSNSPNTKPNGYQTPSSDKWVTNKTGALVSTTTSSYYEMLELTNKIGTTYDQILVPYHNGIEYVTNKNDYDLNVNHSRFYGDKKYISSTNSSSLNTYAHVAYNGSGSKNDKWESSNLYAYLHMNDAKAPTVTEVSPLGTVQKGDKVNISITFNEIVNVTGTPLLNTDLGNDFKYIGGSGTNTLFFEGSVYISFNSPIYSLTSINLNGATIKDMAGNNANINVLYRSSTLTPINRKVVYASNTGIDNNLYGGSYASPVKTLDSAYAVADTDSAIVVVSGPIECTNLTKIEKNIELIGLGTMPTINASKNDINIYSTMSIENINITRLDAFSVINIKDKSTLNMYSGVLTGGKSSGVVLTSLATFNMYNGSITGNTSINMGGGVYNNGKFNMYGGSITKNNAHTGGGVYNGNVATFTMSNSSITNNNSDYGGGGGVYNGNVFTISNSSITDNTSSGNGGGVYNDRVFDMSNSYITGNEAQSGGGVYNRNTVTMSNSSISNNTSSYGGGVNNNKGTITMSDSSITDNTASEDGGGIFNNSICNFSNSSITNNKGIKGGGIYNNNEATLSISGGFITDNTASHSGGGIYNNTIGTVSMTDSSITGNTASQSGGGIYNLNMLSISGTINVSENKLSNNNLDNVYLDKATKFTINDVLNIASKIGVNRKTLSNPLYEGTASYSTSSFVADIGSQEVYKEGNKLYLRIALAQLPTSFSIFTYDKNDLKIGESATLTATATPANIAGHTFTYQWYRDDVAIPGKTDKTLTVVGDTSTQGRYDYHCRVTSTRSDNGQTAYVNSNKLIIYFDNSITWDYVGALAVNGIDYTLLENGDVTIYTAKGLAWFAKSVNGGNTYAGKTITLANNIDLKDAGVTNYGTSMSSDNSWQPIGKNYGAHFSGTFDGKGKTISNVLIGEQYNMDNFLNYSGLFGYLTNATIKDTSVEVAIYSDNSTSSIGGIAGFTDESTTIENCNVSGVVMGGTAVVAGGVVGGNGGTIEKSYSTALVSSEFIGGGIVADNAGTIKNCYSTGSVTGSINARVGGLVGMTTFGKIYDSYATGLTSSESSYSGGVIGGNNSSDINNCYYNNQNKKGIGMNSGEQSIHIVPKSLEQFASGEVAYLLNGSTSEGNLTWGQNVDNGEAPQSSPVINGAIVYMRNNTYTNEAVADISVDITWGGMEFTYKNKTWNTEKHIYEGDEWTINNNDGNKITTSNQGGKDVNVIYAYSQIEGEIMGSFTDGTNPITGPVKLLVNENSNVYLSLDGKPTKTLNSVSIGNVTVTVIAEGSE